MKKAPWQQMIALPQTYGLMASIVLGFGGLVGIVGNRPLVWVGGSSVSLAMVGSWVWGFRSSSVSLRDQGGQNWLEREPLLDYLQELEQNLPREEEPTWRNAKTWVLEAQGAAQQIVKQDPLLHGDIIETLHTVIDLVTQVAEALNVQANIQTPVYRKVARHHLQASCDRLKASNEQLKQLQDQLMLSKLERSLPGQTSPLPQHLQTLIAANKLILEQNHDTTLS